MRMFFASLFLILAATFVSAQEKKPEAKPEKPIVFEWELVHIRDVKFDTKQSDGSIKRSIITILLFEKMYPKENKVGPFIQLRASANHGLKVGDRILGSFMVVDGRKVFSASPIKTPWEVWQVDKVEKMDDFTKVTVVNWKTKKSHTFVSYQARAAKLFVHAMLNGHINKRGEFLWQSELLNAKDGK